jgi:pyruvate dehydrogenase E2 component (dihydrolipoamide acetyltransferase)
MVTPTIAAMSNSSTPCSQNLNGSRWRCSLASQVIMPKLTDQMEEGHVLEWLCSESEAVSVGQPLFVVETDKAAIEVPADQEGTLLKILVPAGSAVPTGTPVAWIGAPGEAIPEVERPAPVQEPAARTEEKPVSPPAGAVVAAERPERVLASPFAKRLARELGVGLKAVQEHTGRRRLTRADVQAYADAQETAVRAAPTEKKLGVRPEVEFTLVEPTPLQRTMAARMTESAAIPQFANAVDVDLTNLEQFRSELMSSWEACCGFRLTYTHILAAMAVRALESQPILNASWTPEGIRLYGVVNLGVAMATERGLVVPVVRRANQLSLEEIASEIVRLQQAAGRNRLLPDDLAGGTFTLTNVGMMGITLSIPVLNPPQSGILAVAAKRDRVTVENGELKSLPVTTITLVADHRIVDGAMGAAFLRRVKELVENPWLVLLKSRSSGSISEGGLRIREGGAIG